MKMNIIRQKKYLLFWGYDSHIFVCLKGGGHTAAEYKPKECFDMFTSWLDNEAL